MKTIEDLRIHPFKSCGAVSVPYLDIRTHGPRLDREFVIVDATTNKFIQGTARHRMTQLSVSLLGDNLCVTDRRARDTSKNMTLIKLQPWGLIGKWSPERFITVYDKTQLAFDQGDHPATWFSEVLGKPCRVMRTHPDYMPSRYIGDGIMLTVAGHDSSPIHLLSEASLSHLARRVPAAANDLSAYNALSPARFRPNILVGGKMDPYEEEAWGMIRIGKEVILEVRKNTPRCDMIQVNPDTGVVSQGLLNTLRVFKPNTKGLELGTYLFPICCGRIHLGDEVAPI